MFHGIKESRGDKLFLACNYLYVFLAFLIVFYPLVYMISASISDPKAVASGEMWLWPKGITLEGYKMVFKNTNIWIGYENTIIYTVVGTAINLFVTLPAAYALSRRDFVGRNFFMGMFMVTMFFSGGLIPTYLLVKELGMMNSMWAIVLPSAASIWNIIVSRTFFQSSIPKELQEAAQIDGCSNMRLFFRIILPLSLPIIAVMALFYGVGNWNSYFSALIYLNEAGKYPLQLVLRQILVLQEMGAQGGGAIDISSATAMNSKAEIAALVKYAVIIVATIPVIVIYPFLQRYFVQGVMIGSVKG
ncbi:MULTISPECIES: carbohydrate ABC transporter permease [Paenibacillus]|uniref:Sugar ABC transporter permease n=1 Tax=Paenibacillus glycanilyticus TaxID=126569 RepID=A0ABQ6NUH6_9BACL|nr:MULTISPECIES: carbohydrate ABC transporter permease [Paenibacillus]MCK9859333.1 carbohydrate ABC transporter permease [Paenibacillus sp. ATY16]GMK47792.1 sugar ABC transporter permease [Paenibacillus glycanilyticus]